MSTNRRFYHHLLAILQPNHHHHHHHRKAIQQVHSHLTTTKQTHQITIWNTLIRHYCLGPFPEEALLLYKHHQLTFPDSFTYSFLIKACTNLGQPATGSQLHCQSFKAGLEFQVHVQTALVNMYVDCGWLVAGKKVFDEMPERNSVSWNVMITGLAKWGELGLARKLFDVMPAKNVVSWTGLMDGYTRANQHKEALSLFRRMVLCEGIKPTEVTILAIFPAIWNLGSLDYCRMIHTYVEKSGLNVCDIRVTNALIDAYAKSGCVKSALTVFHEIAEERKNLVSWTTIITGLAMYGMGTEAVGYFRSMENVFMPNRVTFLSVLNACSHGGLVEEGLELFDKMVYECGIPPDIKHYGCMIDMLGRAGRLKEAEKMALEIEDEMANVVIWRILLGACSFHSNVEMADRVTRKIMEIERSYGGDYVLLSNIFAAAGKFSDSERVRRVMDERNASKVPGNCWV